jgi:hypothetical protein
MLKAIFEIWGEGPDFDSAMHGVRQYCTTIRNNMAVASPPGTLSWSMGIEGVGN